MKKALALALAMLMLVACLAGCGDTKTSPTPAGTSPTPTKATDTPTPAPTPSPISGKLTFSLWDFTAGNMYIQNLIDGFKALYPDVEIEVIDTPSADYTAKLGVDLNGGAAADVLLIKDADTAVSYNKKGQLMDLAPFIARDGVDLSIYNGLAENFNFDGKQVGLPYRTDYYVLYYNKAVFDAAGEAYPKNDMTWAEFEALAKKLTKGEGADKTYGAHFHTWQACVENWAVQGGKGTIMGPDYSFMKPAYEMILRMQNDDKTIQDYATLKTGNIHYSSAFYAGNVGMMPMGTWFIATLVEKIKSGEVNVDFGVATLPHFDGVKAGETVGSTTPIAINAAAKNPEAAWAFLQYCTSLDGGKILAEAGGFAGCINSDMLGIITSNPLVPAGTAEALTVENIVLDRPIVEHVSEVNTMLGEEHGLVMLGESTLDQFITNVTDRAKGIVG